MTISATVNLDNNVCWFCKNESDIIIKALHHDNDDYIFICPGCAMAITSSLDNVDALNEGEQDE